MKLTITLFLFVLSIASLTSIVAVRSLNAQNATQESAQLLLLTNAQEQYELGAHVEILEDSTKQLTIEDVVSPEFTSRFEPSETTMPGKGYDDSAYWVRVQLQNQSDLTEWWLHHNQADIHFIDLYMPNEDGEGFQSIQTGALMPFETRDIPATTFVFRLSIPLQSTQTVYVRYEHSRATDLPLQLQTPGAFVDNNQLELWTQGLGFSLALILLILATYLAYSFHSKTLLYAGLALTLFVINVAVLSGFVSQYFVPDLGEWFVVLEFLTGGLLLVALLKFATSFLDTAQHHPTWHWILHGLIAICLLIILQIPFVSDGLVAQQLVIVWSVGFVALILLSLQVGFQRRRVSPYFVVGGLIVLLLSVWTFVSGLGIGANVRLAQSFNRFSTVGLFIVASLITADQLAKSVRRRDVLAEELAETNVLLERRIEDRTRELSALYDITSVSSQALDVNSAMEISLRRVVEAMQGDAGAIHLLDESAGMLHLTITEGVAPDSLDQVDTIPVGFGLPGWVIEHRDILLVADMTTDPRSSPATANQHIFQAYAGVPIQVGELILGVLSIVRKRDRPLFGVEEVTLLGSIADQVGVVVESARLKEQVEQIAIVEERSRLARELHDSVTQLLYSINLYADVGRESYRLGKFDQMYSSLDELGKIGQQALKEMRLFVYELRPPILEREGLVSALRNRLETVEGRANIETRLFAEEDIDLSKPQEEALFHIAQEALNNTLKHTEATLATVRIRSEMDQIEMEITDNGQGFDPDGASKNGGLGLININERVNKLGGKLRIRSSPEQGTRLQVTFRKEGPDGG